MTRAATEKRNIATFIASPGDLAEERRLFREVIDKLNKGFGDGAGVTFEALGWEDTLSTVGRRPQSVINQDIDRCDVFILVLNRRWGQNAPDSEYSSYTEEEFHRALDRFRMEKTPRIFIFFRRVDPASEADPGPQLKKVMEFRQSLEESKEVLYRYIDDAGSFAQEVDEHLRAYAKGELPRIDSVPDVSLLPLTAIAAVKEAKEEAQAAVKRAGTAEEKAEKEAARVLELSLEMAEDAAEAALDGKLEKARQRFALAIAGTTNTRVLFLAFEFYLRTGDIDAAEKVVQRCLAVSAHSPFDLANTYCNLGIVYKTRGDLNEAEAMYRKSLALFEELDDRRGMANGYNNLGIVHKTRGDLDEAEAMQCKALALFEELDDKKGMGDGYSNLGNVHKKRGDLSEAETMYRKALALNEELGCKEGMAKVYGNLGIVHKTHGDLDEAEAMYCKALALNEALGRKEGMAINYANLGGVHKISGDMDEAEAMYRKALALFEELGSPNADRIRNLLLELDADTGAADE